MKNWTKFLILPSLVLCTLFCLAGCGETPNGIKLNSSFKTEYYIGDELDLTGGILDYTEAGTTTQVVVTEDMVSGFSTETAGSRNLVITYKNYTTLVEYNVKDLPAFPNIYSSVYKSQESIESGSKFYIAFNTNNMAYIAFSSQDKTRDDLTNHGNAMVFTKSLENGSYKLNLVDQTGVTQISSMIITDLTNTTFTMNLNNELVFHFDRI